MFDKYAMKPCDRETVVFWLEIGGYTATPHTSDIWWSATTPEGNKITVSLVWLRNLSHKIWAKYNEL